MIKPSAFKSNYTGAILKMINEAGFVIKAMKVTRLSKEQAGAFYEIHKGKPFYESLVNFMSSGPIVAAMLEKENAVAETRLVGCRQSGAKQRDVATDQLPRSLSGAKYCDCPAPVTRADAARRCRSS